jgi:plastocyanin
MRSTTSWSFLMLPLLLAACSDDTTKPSPDLARAGDRGAIDQSTTTGDRAPTEKGVAAEKGASADSTPAGCAISYAGCSSYQDATSNNPTITFGTGGNIYDPKCVKVKVGQSVTFSGTFAVHPLAQASCAPAQTITSTSSGTTATFTFNTPGVYGFYCTVHGTPQGTGMAGSIMVVP